MTRPDLRPARAAALYLAGASQREIAAAFGIDQRTVDRWLDADQVPQRRRGPRGRLDVADSLVQELIEDERLSFRVAGELVGMSKTGVRMRYYRIIGRPRSDRTRPDHRAHASALGHFSR
jgi:transposase